MHGGGHERGMRSGTLPTHQIVGMGAAFKLGAEVLADESARIEKLRTRLWEGVSDMQEVYLNGSSNQHVPGIINISFAYVEGESLIMALRDLAVSSGSACTSASLEPSYVLRALGLNDEMAHSSIRFSIGRYTSEQDVDDAIAKVRHAVEKLRELSPLWDMFQDGVDLDQVEWAAH
jgi:cysteine desulfurase